MKLAGEQLTAALAALAGFSDDDLDAPSPEPVNSYAPTAGAAFAMLGSHWMMHSGQWVVVRRQLGRPPLFLSRLKPISTVPGSSDSSVLNAGAAGLAVLCGPVLPFEGRQTVQIAGAPERAMK